MFKRSFQLDQFNNFSSNGVIKVFTGVRRAGKTILLRQVKDSLRRQGVENKQLTFIRFNQLHRGLLADQAGLLASIKDQLNAAKESYLFLDELDQVDHACPLLQQLNNQPNTSLFVTTSSRSLLTQLSPLQDQLMVIPVLPLSFTEFCQYHRQPANRQALYQYLNTGGFPFAQSVHDQLGLENYLDEVFNTILVGGFTKHGTLCNPFLTKQLAIFLASQAGQPVNASKAVTGLRRMGIPASNKTLASYLDFLQDTFFFYPCYELDLATNRSKPTNVRYYPVDPSLRNYLTNQKGVLSQTNLEALLFIELVRRGYQVHSSKRFTFVAERNRQRSYIQFVYSLRNQQAYDRAIAGLRALPAGCHRQLITMQASDMLMQDPAIPLINFIDWLVTA